MNKFATVGGMSGGLAAALVLSSFGVVSKAAALEYYTWVDEHGITHFSEEPPESGQVRRVRASFPAPASRPQDPEADYYSIVNQSRRMEARRLEREKALAEYRLERERLRLQREQLELEAYQTELWSQSNSTYRRRDDLATAYTEYVYLDRYDGYRGRHDGRKGNRARQGRKGYRTRHGRTSYRGKHEQRRRAYGKRHSYGYGRDRGYRRASRYGGGYRSGKRGAYRSRSVGIARPARHVGPGRRR